MPDRGSYASFKRDPRDPRRSQRLAERGVLDDRDPLGRGVVTPGVVSQEAASINQLLASGIEFDRASFSYDVTGYGPYTCNGAQDGTGWTKLGSNPGNLRVPLGPISDGIYAWVWATFGWSVDASSTGDAGRCVAVLYDSLAIASHALVRAANPMSNFLPANGNFYEMTYLGFIGINPSEDAVLGAANPSFTGEETWNLGIQQQYSGPQKVTKTMVNRQSIVVFATGYPQDGVSNFVQDALLA